MFEIDLKDFFKEAVGSVRNFRVSGILQKKIQPFLVDKLDVKGEISVKRQENSAVIVSQIDYKVQASCDRCQKDFTFRNHQAFTKYLSDEKLRHLKFGQYPLLDDIIESIILNKPITIVCKTGCRGLCSGCGADLNEESCNCSESDHIKNNPFIVLKRDNHGSTEKENFKSQNRQPTKSD
jgi:uncharacterized protein